MITVVSGLPRSGTSMMMQMLVAGGMTALTDDIRLPDEDNPRGYLEWSGAPKLGREPQRIAEAEGKAVKIISQQLFYLPMSFEYRVIFMRRPWHEVMASQDKMMRRLGTQSETEPHLVVAAFARHLLEVAAWYKANRSHVQFFTAPYHDVLDNPKRCAEQLNRLLGLGLDVNTMAGAVDLSLYRNRRG